jgi:pimeloyl-ACP methyl ester carboxylesterase
MASLVGLVSVFLAIPSYVSAFVPTSESIGSDLSIITHNDLYGNLTTRRAGSIVLGTSSNYATAISKCATLGAAPWNPDSYSTQDLDYLRYLDYEKATDNVGVYWVKGNQSSHCRAITTHGKLKRLLCSMQLPVLCSSTATNKTSQIAITTNNATIIGRREPSSSSFRFLGIKYASIPARFAHSTYLSPTPGSDTTALEYAPQCIQSGCGAKGGPPCTEDCLTLNIWTPYLPKGQNTTRKGKAVMVWIHGGGFTGGTGSDPTFDGSAMASRGDVVLVTINHRLSTLGFLALDNTTLTGNYGLQDQDVALDWLRAHIGAFGGDKDRITIFGQSAGAASVRALLASPQSQGKVSGAILMSNPQGVEYASTFSEYLTIPEATNLTQALVAEVGCARLMGEDLMACLRRADPLQLVGFRNATQKFSGTLAR